MSVRRLVIVVLALALWPSAAIAEDSREAARALGERGLEHYHAGDYQRAYDAFAKANAEFPALTFVLFMARSRAQQQRLLEARKLYDEVVKSAPAPDEPRQFAEARGDARRETLALQARIPRLIVEGSVTRLRVDGVEVETSMAGIEVDPGQHRVEATVSGRNVVRNVTVTEGARRRVRLSPAAPLAPRKVSPRATDAPKSSALPWVAFGVGAAGLAVGTVAGLMAMSQSEAIKSDCQGNVCPSRLEDDGRSAETTALVSTVGFAVAGVGIGAGVLFLALEPSASGSGDARLGMRGRF